MRISKIFHWLYASVLLMPIFAIGIKSLYVTFNPNSKDSYYGETINEEQNVNVKVNQLENNKIYYFMDFTTLETETGNSDIIFMVDNFEFNDEVDRIRFYINPDSKVKFVQLLNGSTSINYTTLTTLIGKSFNYLGQYSTSGSNYLNNKDVFYTVEYNDYSYIDNVFYYSVYQISNEPLFSWAKTSFLAQPLLFITNLFGLPNTSPIITFLSYWFDISIIWLVFDAIMYFPLLIHRWLDKGVIE